jgi:glutathione S-transferase
MPAATPSARAKPKVVPLNGGARHGAAKTIKTAAAKGSNKRTTTGLATLTLSSKNYSSWSLRGWLMARFVGLEFDEVMVAPDDANARKELLLLAPSILVPCLEHEGAKVWNVLAIGHYLDEVFPKAGLLPDDRIARAHCRSVCGEMNSGFANLRSSLPVNLKGHFPGHKIWTGAKPDIERIGEIWRECISRYGGPYLYGAKRGMADAMFAPVVTRFVTYDVQLDRVGYGYCKTIMAMPEMQEWIAAAKLEPEDIEELDMDF